MLLFVLAWLNGLSFLRRADQFKCHMLAAAVTHGSIGVDTRKMTSRVRTMCLCLSIRSGMGAGCSLGKWTSPWTVECQRYSIREAWAPAQRMQQSVHGSSPYVRRRTGISVRGNELSEAARHNWLRLLIWLHRRYSGKWTMHTTRLTYTMHCMACMNHHMNLLQPRIHLCEHQTVHHEAACGGA